MFWEISLWEDKDLWVLPYYFLAVWLWGSHLTSLGFSFCICKIPLPTAVVGMGVSTEHKGPAKVAFLLSLESNRFPARQLRQDARSLHCLPNHKELLRSRVSSTKGLSGKRCVPLTPVLESPVPGKCFLGRSQVPTLQRQLLYLCSTLSGNGNQLGRLFHGVGGT